jgi:hypothetical protein
MDVRLFPNSARPGIGLKPRRESQRPLLPQHARHCPVLEAGSSLGLLVYPPLTPEESYSLEYKGEGQYQFVYYVNPSGEKWEPIFSVTVVLPVGGIGAFREEVAFMIRKPMLSREQALAMTRFFIVPEDLGTPAGGLSLRGAWNFKTPAGWDSVFTPVFNMIERPLAPMLVVRVETDWYMHETEFRYVLQQGEMYSAAHSLPIGQVFFVPREEVSLHVCSDEEVTEIRRTQEQFSREKAGVKVTSGFGTPYSPHYLRKSRPAKT